MNKEKLVIKENLEEKGEKEETAPEVLVQELLKCAYLGCKNTGLILDDVEIAEGIYEKQLVCNEHLGQLNKHITMEGKCY